MIIRQCVQQRQPLPDAIANAPQLHLGLELFFQAFMELNTCRGGMGDGPIPWIAILQYCNLLELDEDTTDDMFLYLRAMDDAWRKHQEKKSKAKARAGKK